MGLDLPASVEIKAYVYQNSAVLDITDSEASDIDEAPDGYPGKTCTTLSGPIPPTRPRMFSGGGGGWAAYQPAPTSQNMQQFNQAPAPPMPPAGGPKKRAFICGINYTGTSAQLSGCINDARCMEFMLKSKFDFQQDQILLMTDDNPNPVMRPTRANMMNGMTWLMTGIQPGDSLVFHYSGHGSQKRDFSGEELDGMNETLCPLDFQRAGEIEDDHINRMLINPLPQGVKLHAIIDACHSGSVLDLPYQATVRAGTATWNSAYAGQTRGWKGTAGGFAVQFSAATDQQTAADTAKLSGGVATGAATFCFIKAIEDRGKNLTYGDLLLAMWHTLQQAGLGTSGGGGMQPMPPMPMFGGGLDSMLMAMLGAAGGGGGFRGQEPVLSANYAFDLSYKFSL